MTHTLTATEKINQLIDENVLLKQWTYCAWVTLAKGIEIMDLDQIRQWSGVRWTQEAVPLSEEDIQIFNENPPSFDMDVLYDIQHPSKSEMSESEENVQQATPLEAELLVWIKNAAGQMRYVADMLEEAEMMNQWPGYNQIMDRCPVVLPDHHGRVCADCGKPAEMMIEKQPICHPCKFRFRMMELEQSVSSKAWMAAMHLANKGIKFASMIEQHDRTELSDENILMLIPAPNAGHPFAELIASLKDERDKLKG